MDDLSGRVIKGYELRERIGAGGFGAVYRAYQSAVGREVAVKAILPAYANQPDFIRLFETEAQLVARLEHPFIVPLFDYWREPDGAYLVMRLLRGGSLRTALDSRRFSNEEALHIIEQITGALAVAHRNNVIHRDLKPDNILLDDDGNAFLSDFGIAKVINKDTDDDDGITGSPGYMSPEQIILSPVTPQTDIYSLGIIIFELLTGCHPFPDTPTSQLIFKQLQEPLPDIQTINVDLPYQLNDIIQRATAKEQTDRYPDVLSLLNALKEALTPETAQLDTAYSDIDLQMIVNPYKGLRAFEEADSADFFGRELLIKQLLSRLEPDQELSRFLAVVGPSGSGKSSVVKAGLIPALRWGDISGSQNWFIVEFVPGTAPLEKLEAALESVAVKTVSNLTEILKSSTGGLIEAEKHLLPEGAELLIVIDQFEEVFTLTDNETERTHFLNLIRTAVMTPDSAVRIIVTLRADFYDRPLLYEGFGALMRSRTEVVLPLSSEELERAITGPAERVGLIVEAPLLAALISDVKEEPGALPMLQYVLTEVYERRDGRYLTLQAYQDSGGALGALARRADEIFAAMDEAQRAVTRQLFLRLVTLGEGTEDTRRRAHWQELTSSIGSTGTLQSVLETFGKYRLLSFDRDPQTRDPTVEVAHEALIREWKQLREWLNASREDVRLQRNLATSSGDWVEAGKDASFLLRGSRLTQYDEWIGTTDLALTRLERDYFDASVALRDAQEQLKAEQIAREKALEQQSRNRLRILVTVLAAGFIMALALSALAYFQSQEAQTQRNIAQTQVSVASTAQFDAETQKVIAENEAAISRSLALSASAAQLSSTGSTDLALALALEANRITNPPSQAQLILAQIAYAPGMIRRLGADPNEMLVPGTAHTAPVTGVQFSPDGETLISSSTDGNLILWDTNEKSENFGKAIRAFTGHMLPVASVTFTPDGKSVVSGSWDRTLILWQVADADQIRQFGLNSEGHQSVVSAVEVTPDGEVIVSGSSDGLILWDLATGEIIRRIPEAGEVTSLAISPDGQQIFSGDDDGVLTLWSLESGELVNTLREHTSTVLDITFSADGLTALSTSRDSSMILWTLETGIGQRFNDVLSAQSISASSITFSPDGRFLMTGSDDNTVIFWDMASGRVINRFNGHTAAVKSVAFSPNGGKAASASDDQSIILWQVADAAVATEFGTHASAAADVGLTTDGQRAFSAGEDGLVTLWDTTSGEELQQINSSSAHSGRLLSAALSPDGTHLLTGAEDQLVVLWNVETGEVIQCFEGHTAPITTLNFSPDGKTALSGAEDDTLILWEIESGEMLRTLTGHNRRVLSASFSPDGARILSGAGDRTLILWDTATGEIIHQMEGHDRRVLSAVFSPDGQRALSGSDDTDIILWDLTTGQEIRRFTVGVDGNAQTIYSVAFSPDGKRAVSGAEDGTLSFWDVEDGLSSFGETVRVLTTGSTALTNLAFSPDGTSVLTGSRSGVVGLWEAPTLSGLIEWTERHRFVPELTCIEREQYNVLPLCE